MEASLNHGNSLNGRNSSSCPSINHTPCPETLVTSGSEVLMPSAADFIDVALDQCLRRLQTAFAHAGILRRFDARLNPKLRLTV
jgi:hypothetical protein